MSWKTAYRSFYYRNAPLPQDIRLPRKRTALLMIDLQNVYVAPHEDPAEAAAWTPFMQRMREVVLPNAARLIARCRAEGVPVLHARIACQTADGRERSLSHRKPGFNDLLLPHEAQESQIIPEVAPAPGEIVVAKTTDSALTGTPMRLMLNNMDVRHVIVADIFTDQCVSSTVRSLADESFDVVLAHDAAAAGTMELHERELEVLNMIYCQVASTDETLGFLV